MEANHKRERTRRFKQLERAQRQGYHVSENLDSMTMYFEPKKITKGVAQANDPRGRDLWRYMESTLASKGPLDEKLAGFFRNAEQDAVRHAFLPTSFVNIRKLPQYQTLKEGLS